MLGDKCRQLGNGFNASVLADPRAFKAFIMSGSGPVLPPARPLRTVRASFPAHGSSKSTRGGVLAIGMDKNEVAIDGVCLVPIARDHADGFAIVE